MSSTRQATDSSVFRQERFASAPEFERGLMANLVARRCAVLEGREARQLIWFIQKLSHEPGGIKKLIADLMAKCPERFVTRAMQRFGTRSAQVYSAEQANTVRHEIEMAKANDFDPAELLSDSEKNLRRYKAFKRCATQAGAQKCPASDFVGRCREAASQGLENLIMELALDPAMVIGDDGPWYFPTLISTLREFQAEWIAARQPEVVTSIGEKVCDALEYAIARKN
jgi:hypothetical protein